MRTVCFVTYELYPVTRGGCGALLHNLATQLLAAGYRVVFLLDGRISSELVDPTVASILDRMRILDA